MEAFIDVLNCLTSAREKQAPPPTPIRNLTSRICANHTHPTTTSPRDSPRTNRQNGVRPCRPRGFLFKKSSLNRITSIALFLGYVIYVLNVSTMIISANPHQPCTALSTLPTGPLTTRGSTRRNTTSTSASGTSYVVPLSSRPLPFRFASAPLFPLPLESQRRGARSAQFSRLTVSTAFYFSPR